MRSSSHVIFRINTFGFLRFLRKIKSRVLSSCDRELFYKILIPNNQISKAATAERADFPD